METIFFLLPEPARFLPLLFMYMACLKPPYLFNKVYYLISFYFIELSSYSCHFVE
jgi:hypothetical protein